MGNDSSLSYRYEKGCMNTDSSLTDKRYNGSLGGSTNVRPVTAAITNIISIDIRTFCVEKLLDTLPCKATKSLQILMSSTYIPTSTIHGEGDVFFIALEINVKSLLGLDDVELSCILQVVRTSARNGETNS